ncbi:MAG: hypothetical protein J5496_07760 [Lachnospiraceae bacterium]|nr:hypothetical protein [Lachnospiraceae bacterium]
MAESRSKEKSPVEQDRLRRRKIILFSVLTVLTLFCVYLLTSYLDKTKHGEKWTPFAFLFGTTAEPTLPISPTIPLDVLLSIAEAGTGTAPVSSVPVSTETETDAVITSEETVPPESVTEEPTEEPTTEEPTTEEPTTEEPTTEEPTTAEPTTEETTAAPLPTEGPTTEESVPTTTEETEPFEETDLAAHLKEAGFSEDQLVGTQLVAVRCLDEAHCTLYFFDKTEDGWTMAAAVPAAGGYFGAGGLSAEKLPGDQTTPAGYYPLGPAYGMLPSAVTKMTYHQFQSGDVWVTDPSSAFYNSLQNNHDPAADWSQSLSLLTQDETYKYAVLISYNCPEPDPALGTAIFLNAGPQAATDGSISLKEATLFTLLQWLTDEDDPHILIYQGRNR